MPFYRNQHAVLAEFATFDAKERSKTLLIVLQKYELTVLLPSALPLGAPLVIRGVELRIPQPAS